MVTTLNDPGPFRVRVYDSAFTYLFPLGDAEISITLRHLALGTGTLTIPLAHNRCDAMLTPGTRVTIDYLIGTDRTDDASWVHAMSGWLTGVEIPADQSAAGKSVTFGIVDDYWVLLWMLGWPNPASGIGSQGASAYDTRTGAAETVIKGYVTANASRLGIPLTCATNLSRGASVKGNLRFDNLNDVLPPLAGLAGLGISVKQSGSGLVLDVYVPTDRTSRVLSEAAGTIQSWSLNSTYPTVTRAIVANSGQGTSRAFSEVIDGTGLEALYGVILETFVDARDTADSTTLIQRGTDAVTAGAPQAGYSITVNETPVVRAMKNLFPGDRVAVQITPTLALADVMSELTITWSSNGLVVAPQVGTSTVSPNAVFAKAVSSVARGLRYLRSSQ